VIVFPTLTTRPWIHGLAADPIELPPGEIVLTEPVVIRNVRGPIIRGAGRYRTVIRWRGPAGVPVFSFRSCSQPEITDLTIVADQPARSAVCLSTDAKPTVTNTTGLVTRVWIEGAKRLTYGVEFNNRADGGSDNNGEFHRVLECDINDTTEAAVVVGASQAHRCSIERSLFRRGKAVVTGLGSTRLLDCMGYGFDIVANLWSSNGGAGVIRGNNFENCRKFINCQQRFQTWEVTDNRCDGMIDEGTGGVFSGDASVYLVGGNVRFERNLIRRHQDTPTRLVFQSCGEGLSVVGNTFGKMAPHWTFAHITGPIGEWRYNTFGVNASTQQIPKPTTV
jgi:hypothetical protein